MTEQEREHVTEGLDCWCAPTVDSYGADEDDEDEDG